MSGQPEQQGPLTWGPRHHLAGWPQGQGPRGSGPRSGLACPLLRPSEGGGCRAVSGSRKKAANPNKADKPLNSGQASCGRAGATRGLQRKGQSP